MGCCHTALRCSALRSALDTLERSPCLPQPLHLQLQRLLVHALALAGQHNVGVLWGKD